MKRYFIIILLTLCDIGRPVSACKAETGLPKKSFLRGGPEGRVFAKNLPSGKTPSPPLPPTLKRDPSPVWPTPNTAFFARLPEATYLQPTASGRMESSKWGYTRFNRAGKRRLHRGIDIKAIHKQRNRVTDPIFAAYQGVVRYVNAAPARSGYGRFIVIEHTMLSVPIYTLYAHLSEVCVKAGSFVRAGQRIGTMGTSACYRIPFWQAHLHFEMGLRLSSEHFVSWYGRHKRLPRNPHGSWHLLNFLSFDALAFYQRNQSVINFIQSFPTAFTLRITSRSIPDFIRRYPALCTTRIPTTPPCAWQVDFTWFGLPMRWTPIVCPRTSGTNANGQVYLVSYNSQVIKFHNLRNVLPLNNKNQPMGPGTTLTNLLQIIFNFQKIYFHQVPHTCKALPNKHKK